LQEIEILYNEALDDEEKLKKFDEPYSKFYGSKLIN
jgi:hypothetical protein